MAMPKQKRYSGEDASTGQTKVAAPLAELDDYFAEEDPNLSAGGVRVPPFATVRAITTTHVVHRNDEDGQPMSTTKVRQEAKFHIIELSFIDTDRTTGVKSSRNVARNLKFPFTTFDNVFTRMGFSPLQVASAVARAESYGTKFYLDPMTLGEKIEHEKKAQSPYVRQAMENLRAATQQFEKPETVTNGEETQFTPPVRMFDPKTGAIGKTTPAPLPVFEEAHTVESVEADDLRSLPTLVE